MVVEVKKVTPSHLSPRGAHICGAVGRVVVF